ncbi:MAG: helicase-related protein, partial [Deltaproteobacteria bacterium]|nr:helicase-related protein [Deltaproteobacteria bacterium]
VSWAKLQYCPMRQTEQVIVRLFEDFIDASSVSFNGNQTEIKNQIKPDSHLTRNQKNALRCADLVLDLFSHYWSGGVESAVSFFGSRESVGDRRFYCLPKRAKDEINQSLRDDANFRFNLMLQTLLKALNDRPSWQAIIFVEEVFSAVAWEAALTKRGIAVKTYHSDEPERVKNLEAFKVGSLRVLVSTKAGFTGLDIQDKGCIVAFPGFLSSLTDYIQSLGRSRNSCQVLGWPAFGFDKFPNFCRFAREKHNYFLEAVNSCQMRIQETLYGQESIFELF